MLKNYLKISLRTLRRYKLPTFINVGGLAVAIACCLLIFLFIQRDWSYDTFNPDAGRIYRVDYLATQSDGSVVRNAVSPSLTGPTLRDDYPEVDLSVRIGRKQLRVSTRRLTDETETVTFADPGLFELFALPLVSGDASTALAEPTAAVLTASAAKRYFGDVDVVGRTLSVKLEDDDVDFTVAGVASDVPPNSNVSFGIVLPYARFGDTYGTWFRDNLIRSWKFPLPVIHTFVRLSRGADPGALEAKLGGFVQAHIPERYRPKAGYALQPLLELHHAIETQNALVPPMDPRYSFILGGIALMVLLIASINFVTLILGRSATRALEVGVRKVMGAQRRQIRGQFWSESMLTATLALIAGCGLVELFLPTFNDLTNQRLSFDFFHVPMLWFAAGTLVLAVGLLAGAYPAIILSRLQPTAMLKGTSVAGGRRWFTKVLVTLQFALSIGLVSGTLVMSRQLDYMLDKDLGFDPAHVLVFSQGSVPINDLDGIKQTLETLPQVAEVSSAFDRYGNSALSVRLQTKTEDVVSTQLNVVGTDYVDLMGIEIVQGQGFHDVGMDRRVLINETLVNALGWEDPVGRPLPVVADGAFGAALEGTIIGGVVRDYHTQSLHEPIEPVVLVPQSATDGIYGTVGLMRLRPGPEGQALAAIQETWRRILPDVPFQYSFLSDDVASTYAPETRWRTLVAYVSLFAMLIACSGLFGLAALAAGRRAKEMGIRKVLGASAGRLVALLSFDFLKLTLVATVVAAPLTYLAVDRWLETFAYRTDDGPWLFLAAGVIAAAVTLVTVGYHALRAATADPVKALRYE